MRYLTVAAATLAAAAFAVPSQALIYYSNYTPSQTDFVQTGGAYPVKRRLPDATQSFDTSAPVQEYLFQCCTIRFESVSTQFVAPTTFTAAAIVVPLRHVYSIGNRNMGINVERFDTVTSSWVAAGQDSYAIIPSLATGVVTEVEARFGLNLTNLPEQFAPRPITFNAGETYRFRMAFSAGGIGTVDWYLSDQAATAGQSQRFYNYQGTTDLAFQPAFALTDGGDLVFPPNSAVPEPASWAMLITGFGLIGAAARRRRRALAV
ncbi:PEPxxWA-CTERM sorting domain-containing protein [Polymorphobacter sp.]|uniref:PEPxxWA-CTERM sorting domain-containing protein n=1 Tax=Polymorphobacter sp. TaxID=1909290 RepID=UPI003F7295CE